jgi:hypothetical protein
MRSNTSDTFFLAVNLTIIAKEITTTIIKNVSEG